ncbi:hypothetical protein Lalb_Chr09g0324561 [Lupinus albus]|uniref:Uncharacterized protein n=1 Tax=Lupinus albus TaxID=3870 RepID=A0A6A4PZ95_LUPAL|nr:hypothetical protein Lalb_Chr09g0324561 [Lupinus albus]
MQKIRFLFHTCQIIGHTFINKVVYSLNYISKEKSESKFTMWINSHWLLLVSGCTGMRIKNSALSSLCILILSKENGYSKHIVKSCMFETSTQLSLSYSI